MSLFAELKRRNVVKVATLYLVASWLLLQVTDVLSSLLSLPAAVGSTVVIVLLVGFVPVLIFSWVYELTPEGLKRDADIAPETSMALVTGRRMNLLIIGLLLLAVGALVLDRVLPGADRVEATGSAGEAPAQVDGTASGAQPSIAVLPFENFSGASEDEYFSDGLADTLLHHLAQVSGLTVIARNSSFQYKGTNLDVREIGRQLGVSSVLEGSVQRYGEQVRVIAQLVSTSDGSHIWSERYDYAMKDIFALHDAISAAVVDQLRVSLLPEQARMLDQGGTGQTEAYDLFLRARSYAEEHLTPSLINTIDSIENFPAVQMLRAALAIDPDYVNAMIQLADIYDDCAFHAGSRDLFDYCLEKMPPLTERAMALAPGYSASWSIKARYEHRSGEDEAARISLVRALELNPNDASAHLSYAVNLLLDDPAKALLEMDRRDALDPEATFHRPRYIALLRLGRVDEAISTLEANLQDDEHSELLLSDLAEVTYVFRGRPDISVRWTARLLGLAPDSLSGYTGMVRAWNAVGDHQRSQRWLDAAEARWPGNDMLDELRLFTTQQTQGPSAAAEYFDSLRAAGDDSSIAGLLSQTRLCLLTGNVDCAREASEELATALAERKADEFTLTRDTLLLFTAELAELTGSGSPDAAQGLLDRVSPLPRVAAGRNKGTLDIEALILLGREDEAALALGGTLIDDKGYMRWDSYEQALDRGHLVSRLAGNQQFERWRRDYVARRDAARQAMTTMEASGEIPAPPEQEE
ncbi:hypothetical protein [Haliea sp. E17]|uniref:hypothetical protein n=1 Tax=Haliea sp. E17 TaxID=3401576 RepID=UPI003AAF77EA